MTLISVKIFTQTLSCLEEPPCSLELQRGSRKKLPVLHLLPCPSRLSLLQKENTLSGLEDPSLLLCPLLKTCGSPKTNMMNLVHPSSTENVLKLSNEASYGDAKCAARRKMPVSASDCHGGSSCERG